MKHNRSNHFKSISILLFAAMVFCFWGLLHPYSLAWQEQLQLFLFDKQYLIERLSLPGGAATYVAEFLLQFYNHPLMGAIVVAILYLLLQRMVWLLVLRQINEDSTSQSSAPNPAANHNFIFLFTFFPSLLLWYMMEDENMMLALPVSLIMVLFMTSLYPSGSKDRILFSLILIPLTYWMSGPMVGVMVLLLLIKEIRNSYSWAVGLGIGAAQMVYALLCVVLSSWIVFYPLRRLLAGLFYYRIPDIIPYSVIGLALLCVLLVWLLPFASRKAFKKQGWAVVVLAAHLIGAVVMIAKEYDSKKYELIEYDYLVRTNKWEAIISKAEKQQPDLPMSVCALNLALGMTNQMGERTFQFFQNGADGLLPKFEKDFSSSLLTGEAYFQLGLINTAQRFAFEAMESVTNYNKSARVVKRLAETNLINGQYKIAHKYLLILQKTAFYRRWANSRLEMLQHPEQIDAHPLYGRLRKMRLTDDFLFSDTEVDKICGQLFARNNDNTLAMQYLLIYPLLQRNINGFMNYYSYVNSKVRYTPTVCQEAVAFAFMKRGEEAPATMVNANVMQRFKRFAQTYSMAGRNSAELNAFRNTTWYYLMKE